MNYEIVFGQRALDGLPNSLPESAVEELKSQLDRLAADPIGLGKKLRPDERFFPFGQRSGLKYTFVYRHRGRGYAFCAYFLYRENERELEVYDVTVDSFWVL